MSTYTLRGLIIKLAMKREGCKSCELFEGGRLWSTVADQDMRCAIDEAYMHCPWTGVEMPWARKARHVYVDFDESEEE